MPRLSYILVDRPDAFGSFEAFADALQRLKALGYEGVEFSLTFPLGFDLDALVRLTEAISLPVVSFLTGGNYFSDGLCLCSPRADVRERAVQRLTECIHVAARFGAVVVIGQMQGFLSDEPQRTVGEARIEECLKQVTEAAEARGVVLVMEPVNHLQVGFHNSLAEVMALCARIGSPCFKPMLDSFHINIEEKSMTEPIFRAGDDLGHFHLCESNGSLLGSGHLDFKAIFAALETIGYNKFVSLKIYRQPWEVGAQNGIEHLSALGLGR